MKLLFLIQTLNLFLAQTHFYYPQVKLKDSDNIIPLEKEENDNCDGLKKGYCMLEPLCGWCMSKQKCVFSDERVVQQCTQVDTYIFTNPDNSKWDPYSYNHNVEFNSKLNKIQVNGENGKSDLDVTQDLPGITVKSRRRRRKR